MQIVDMTNDFIDFWCPFCGVKNLSETTDPTIQPCPHLEGMLSMGDIIYDVHGIFGKVEGKVQEIEEKVRELLDKKFSEEDHPSDMIRNDKDRNKYWEAKNKAIQECYAEVGFPQEGSWKRINGIGMVGPLDLLKKELDDRYVAFDVGAPPPNPSGGVYLYNFDWNLRDSEDLD